MTAATSRNEYTDLSLSERSDLNLQSLTPRVRAIMPSPSPALSPPIETIILCLSLSSEKISANTLGSNNHLPFHPFSAIDELLALLFLATGTLVDTIQEAKFMYLVG